MQPFQFLTLFVSPLAVMASSVPEPSDLMAKDTLWIGLYMCPQHDWKPADQCNWKRMDVDEKYRGKCFNFTDPANSEKLSFGPDKGVWCYVYTQVSCQGARYLIDYPGTPDLGKTGLALGNNGAQSSSKFKSFACGKYTCDETGKCTFYDATDRGGVPSSSNN